jgi:hypothetical protein
MNQATYLALAPDRCFSITIYTQQKQKTSKVMHNEVKIAVTGLFIASMDCLLSPYFGKKVM